MGVDNTPMSPIPAPFYTDVADGPPDATAFWVTTDDNVRLRMGIWPEGVNGTVLLFPGRTEYIEKYDRVATDLAAAGYSMVAFDWRGQGLSDRAVQEHDVGHVDNFADYQRDVVAFIKALDTLNIKRPWYMLAHSMGGAIGLRALYNHFPVVSAVFTGPMWGIRMSPLGKMVAKIFLPLAGPLGLGTSFVPTTGPYRPMVFDNNLLTADREQFDYMMRQVENHPGLRLGGPSNKWLKSALAEMALLMAMPDPDSSALVMVGTQEEVVDQDAIKTRMSHWAQGRLVHVEGARHELLMESPAQRRIVWDEILNFL